MGSGAAISVWKQPRLLQIDLALQAVQHLVVDRATVAQVDHRISLRRQNFLPEPLLHRVARILLAVVVGAV